MSALPKRLDQIRSVIHNNPTLKAYSDRIEELVPLRIELIVALLAAIPLVMVFYGYGDDPISSLVGFIYPLYASLAAIESRHKEDTVFWLSYWIVYGFIHIIENVLDDFLDYLMIYYPLKILFFLWLYLPEYNGATFLYTKYILKYFIELEQSVDAVTGFK